MSTVRVLSGCKASSGLMTPPCGVRSFASCQFSPSITPCFKNPSMSPRTRPSAMCSRTSAMSRSWGIVSRQPLMSTSTTCVFPARSSSSTRRNASLQPHTGPWPHSGSAWFCSAARTDWVPVVTMMSPGFSPCVTSQDSPVRRAGTTRVRTKISGLSSSRR